MKCYFLLASVTLCAQLELRVPPSFCVVFYMKYFLYFLSILLLVVAFVDFHACAENHVLSRTV